jgi:hypothetical protein
MKHLLISSLIPCLRANFFVILKALLSSLAAKGQVGEDCGCLTNISVNFVNQKLTIITVRLGGQRGGCAGAAMKSTALARVLFRSLGHRCELGIRSGPSRARGQIERLWSIFICFCFAGFPKNNYCRRR